MELINRINDSLCYIEDNLTNEIDFNKAAQLAYSSLPRFQNIFEFLTDMTVGEYVRLRRLSSAAEELRDTDIKISELACKYGYESPEAFTRAFREFHGASPTAAKKQGIFKQFKRINLNTEADCLAAKPLVQMVELKNEKAVVFKASSDSPERDAWNLMRAWAAKNVQGCETRRYLGCAPFGHHPEGDKNDCHEYLSYMVLHDNEVYEGVEITEVPKGVFLVGNVVLNEYDENGDIDIGLSMTIASKIVYEYMLEIGGYELDFDERTFMEEHLFSKEWFITDTPEAVRTEFKFWLPIKKDCI